MRIHKPVKLSHLFDFAYEEELGERKENEFCRVFVRRYDGSYKLNPAEIDSVKFMTAGELKSFVAKKPDKGDEVAQGDYQSYVAHKRWDLSMDSKLQKKMVVVIAGP